HHEVQVVDIGKKTYRQGVDSFSRIVQVLWLAARVAVLSPRSEAVYFTIAQSVAGNLRDVLLYFVCLPKLKRMAIHLHGGAAMSRLLSSAHPWLKLLNGFFLRRVGAVIVLGERLAPIYNGIVAPERIFRVGNFAEDQLFRSRAEVDAKFVSARPLRLLFLSNLLPGKGHRELVGAIRLLPANVRDAVTIDFAGGFETTQDETDFRASLVGLPCLFFRGSVSGVDKVELFGRAHLFCLPTYYPYEGQPISILEAYASGCAVLTTDHGGIFDTFTPEANGFCVEKRSAASIAAAIERAVRDPEVVRTMALRNLATAERFRVSRYNEEILAIVERLGSLGSEKAAQLSGG
ncbi:MAG: glycosyltransferase, partial [Thermoanaerobaculia bacterium]